MAAVVEAPYLLGFLYSANGLLCGPQLAAHSYICSLVADLHRTLLYGGWAGNPRSHLRLVRCMLASRHALMAACSVHALVQF